MFLNRSNNAFTLIELLIVVAIIGILAAIAIPNFLQAQTRAKVAHAQADMRSVAIAMESYALDYNGYPGNITARNYCSSSEAPYHFARYFVYTFSEINWQLTSPVDYISEVITDPFNKWHEPPYDFRGPAHSSYSYDTEPVCNFTPDFALIPRGGWGISSIGPTKIAFTLPFFNRDAFPTANPLDGLYDPTNGTISRGNIARTGP